MTRMDTHRTRSLLNVACPPINILTVSFWADLPAHVTAIKRTLIAPRSRWSLAALYTRFSVLCSKLVFMGNYTLTGKKEGDCNYEEWVISMLHENALTPITGGGFQTVWNNLESSSETLRGLETVLHTVTIESLANSWETWKSRIPWNC